MGALVAILGAIPGIGQIVTFVVRKLYDSKVAIKTAQIGGDTTVAKAMVDAAIATEHERTTALGVIAGSTLLTCLVIAFATPLVFFLWKVVAWDIVVGSFYGCVGKVASLAQCATFSTDPIRAQAAEWANAIIWSIFGSATGLGVASIGAAYFRTSRQ